MRNVSVFLDEVTEWPPRQPGVRAVALVGSHARGDATATSDVDVVVVVGDTRAWLSEPRWVEHFGEPVRVDREDWGLVQSLRVRYRDDLEVEFGVTPPVWVAPPLGPGTSRVIRDGFRALFDPDGILGSAVAATDSGSRDRAESNDVLERIRAARRRLVEQGPSRTRDIEGDFERISVPHEDADLLRDLLLNERPATVVEIGLAYGSSALAIAEAVIANAPDHARHVVIDPHQTTAFDDAGWEVIREAGIEGSCTLIEERSQVALPRLLMEGLFGNAAFVDGSHLFHNVFVDLYFLGQIVRPGGLIILDDCGWPSVATAARYFEVNMGWQPSPTPDERGHDEPPHTGRLRAWRLPDPVPNPSFQDFKAFS